jgi:hypothetical protein
MLPADKTALPEAILILGAPCQLNDTYSSPAFPLSLMEDGLTVSLLP